MDNLKNDAYYIHRLCEDMRFIKDHMEGRTIEMLEDDELLLDSMMFRLIQISENAKKLSDECRGKYENVPWVAVYGLRNRIVHDYGRVDLGIVYETLTVDIPDLLDTLQSTDT